MPVPEDDGEPLCEVIVDGARWGDRFVAFLGVPVSGSWVAAGELFAEELPTTLAALGAARGTDRPAVAGTLLFEQYAHRVAAPVLAALLRDGTVLDARLPQVRAQVVDGTVRRLAFARAPAAGTDAGSARTDAVDALLAGLEPVADAVHRRTRIGRRVLRGSVANAVAMSLLHISWQHDDRARYVDDALALVDSVPEWAGLVNVDAVTTGGEAWMYVDRNTCCQAFRTSVNQARDQKYCSACPVLPRTTTAMLFGRATAAFAARHCDRRRP